ncbi:MAG: carboxypeptidase regulatory-like domain-containing protein [Planctomycetaceae bacterium]|nr:carboxypeptidase regulatory-like domain-containing protein [Planctomycetaceae bacterium]MCB9953068.1 carboxypeptidase regulatory-like domain-containing protein [Planctomycetaceae bacterium]
MKNPIAYILLFSLTLALGCGSNRVDYSNLGLVNVSGTVKLDGAPVSDAIVVFEDLETSTRSYGLTDSSGNYSLQFNSEKSGIIPGEKKVLISTTMKVLGVNSDSEGGEEESEEGEGAAEKPTELIPDAYRGNETKLRVYIIEGESIDFDLASDGSTTGPAEG